MCIYISGPWKSFHIDTLIFEKKTLLFTLVQMRLKFKGHNVVRYITSYYWYKYLFLMPILDNKK